MYKQTLKWEAALQNRGKVTILAWTCVMLYWEISGLERKPSQTSSRTVTSPPSTTGQLHPSIPDWKVVQKGPFKKFLVCVCLCICVTVEAFKTNIYTWRGLKFLCLIQMLLKALTGHSNGCFVVYRLEGLVATGLRHGENFELSRHHPGWVLQELEVWLHLFFLLFLFLFFLLFALLHLLCWMQHQWVNVPLHGSLNWPLSINCRISERSILDLIR